MYFVNWGICRWIHSLLRHTWAIFQLYSWR